MGCCGKPGLRLLRDLVSSPDEERQKYGVWGAFAFSWYHRDEAHGKDWSLDLRWLLDDPDPEAAALARDISAVLRRQPGARGPQARSPK